MPASCFARTIIRLACAGLILLAAGAAAGGVMALLLIVIDVILAMAAAPNAFRGGSLVGIVAVPFWFAGAVVVGPPLWAALHFARLRGRRTAIVAGALAGGVATPTVLWMTSGGGAPSLNADSLVGLIVLSAVAGVSGAVAGETIHSLAYRSGETADAR